MGSAKIKKGMNGLMNFTPLFYELAKEGAYGDTPIEGEDPKEVMAQFILTKEEEAQEARMEEQRKIYVDKFLKGSVLRQDWSLPYRLYIPEDMESGNKYPLVLFLHGGGEAGDDNERHILTSDGACIWVKKQIENGEQKCFVLAPQCPAVSEGIPSWGEEELLAVSKAIENVCEEYPVDTRRVYVTGFSMGGGGCIRMNYMYPDRFAAIISCCTAVCTNDNRSVNYKALYRTAKSFKNTRLWLFHSEDDNVVTPEVSRLLVKALTEQGMKRNEDFYYTEYPRELGYKHACWKFVYETKSLRDWMFMQKR